jgi:hypothetical protein
MHEQGIYDKPNLQKGVEEIYTLLNVFFHFVVQWFSAKSIWDNDQYASVLPDHRTRE